MWCSSELGRRADQALAGSAAAARFVCVEPTVWIVENLEDDLSDPFAEGDCDYHDQWATGLFEAHLQSGTLRDGFEQGPVGVDLEVAMRWARARADRIIVRVNTDDEDDHFSAGPDRIEKFLEWPPPGYRAVRRRAAGYEYIDRTSDDPPIKWTARVTAARGWGDQTAGVGATFVAKLASKVDGLESRVTDLQPESWPSQSGGIVAFLTGLNEQGGGGEIARARFSVTASTLDEAQAMARLVAEAALDEALIDAGVNRSRLQVDFDLDELTIFPAGSWLARRNCALDERDEVSNT